MLYDQRRKTQPRQTRQLPRDRMFRPRCLSRKQSDRSKGYFFFLFAKIFFFQTKLKNFFIQDFLRPIVTPYELEVALKEEPAWSGQYILDFDQLLTLNHTGPDETDATSDTPGQHRTTTTDDDDKPVFSLITGTYRHAKRYTNPQNSNTATSPQATPSPSALVLRNQSDTVAAITANSAAAQFLQERRTYRGLDPRPDEDSPGVLEQGRSGVARGYQDDLQHQTYQ